MYLMTSHGTLVCFGPGQNTFVHRPIREIGNPARLVDIELPGYRRTEDFKALIENDRRERAQMLSAGPFAGFEARIAADWRVVTFARDGLYLSALPDTGALAADRTEARGWESFLGLFREDLEDLVFLLRHVWVVGSTGMLVRGAEAKLEDPFALRFGSLAFDLRYNLPLFRSVRNRQPSQTLGPAMTAERASALCMTGLLDGWRIEKLYLFRPLIFFAAFASPEVLAQTFLSIASLLEFGGYRGRIHVITDEPREAVVGSVARVAPGLNESALSVQQIRARDWMGYVAAKYCILDWPDGGSFQPLLFLDPDIVCDRELIDMLKRIAVSSRISAPGEFGHWLELHPGVGSTLIQAAGFSPRYACGFNAGTLGIPNLRDHAGTLQLIRTIIVNRADLYGRDNLRSVDQEVANYVSFRYANFDTELLSRYVRYVRPGGERDTTQRTGLGHFWPFGDSASKLQGMAAYHAALRAASAGSAEIAAAGTQAAAGA